MLPLIERILPGLRAVELQQAADDVLERMSDPRQPQTWWRAWRYRTEDPAHQRAMLVMLARRLGGDWNAAQARGQQVVKIIEQTLG